MRLFSLSPRRIVLTSLSVVLVAIGIAASAPLLSAHAPAISLTIVNNSSRDVSHVYLSPPDQDNWGPDQLNDSAISPGASVSLNNISCSGSSVKVIAEDQDGCFIYQVISCAENATVTIANDSSRDCGG